MNLSPIQQEVVKHAVADDTGLLAGGAVRPGKSYSVLLSFAVWLLNQPASYDHAIVGQSIETIMRNMGFDFITVLNQMGSTAELNKQFGTRIIVPTHNAKHTQPVSYTHLTLPTILLV